jgi:hypothetical protein
MSDPTLGIMPAGVLGNGSIIWATDVGLVVFICPTPPLGPGASFLENEGGLGMGISDWGELGSKLSQLEVCEGGLEAAPFLCTLRDNQWSVSSDKSRRRKRGTCSHAGIDMFSWRAEAWRTAHLRAEGLAVHHDRAVKPDFLCLLLLDQVLLRVCPDLYHRARLDDLRDFLPRFAVRLEPLEEQHVFLGSPAPRLILQGGTRPHSIVMPACCLHDKPIHSCPGECPADCCYQTNPGTDLLRPALKAALAEQILGGTRCGFCLPGARTRSLLQHNH